MKDFDLSALSVQSFATSATGGKGEKSGYQPPLSTGYDTCITGMCCDDPDNIDKCPWTVPS